jgi:glycosyltransferase involved in cell wall biosynthesis
MDVAWDLLITAFLEEFSHPSEKDHVSLVIRSKLDSKNKEEFDNLINGFLEQTKKTRSDLPQIVFLDQLIPYTKLPSLYKAVDCFVLPSHGEGWGLPLMEGTHLSFSVRLSFLFQKKIAIFSSKNNI